MVILHDGTRPEPDRNGDWKLLAEVFLVDIRALVERLEGAELQALAYGLHAAVWATPVDQTIHGKWPWLPETTEAGTDTPSSVVAN